MKRITILIGFLFFVITAFCQADSLLCKVDTIPTYYDVGLDTVLPESITSEQYEELWKAHERRKKETLFRDWLFALDTLTQIAGDSDLVEINQLIQERANLYEPAIYEKRNIRKVQSRYFNRNELAVILLSAPTDVDPENIGKHIPSKIIKAELGTSMAGGMFTWYYGFEMFLREYPYERDWLSRALTFAHEGRHWMYFRSIIRKGQFKKLERCWAQTEIDAYLFENKILMKIGGKRYEEIFERKIRSFRQGYPYNPNCLNQGDIENMTDLNNLFHTNSSWLEFNVSAYFTYLSRMQNDQMNPIALRKKVKKMKYDFSKAFLVDLRNGCSYVASKNPNGRH